MRCIIDKYYFFHSSSMSHAGCVSRHSACLYVTALVKAGHTDAIKILMI